MRENPEDEQVSRLRSSGLVQKDIARELGLSQPRISQILAELMAAERDGG
jgi:predicted transcriptional regulator